MDNYLNPLISEMRKRKNPEIAAGQEKYMRNLFSYLGIKTPERAELLRSHFRNVGKPEFAKINEYVKCLWEQPERDFAYVAFAILDHKKKRLAESDLELLEYMISTRSWWDSVDGCVHFTGPFFKQHPQLTIPITEKWAASDNFWFKRSALLFQLQYGKTIAGDLLFKYCRQMSEENEFFVRKAIGWALRQYSKYEPELVEEFVGKTLLKPLSVREALKIINKKRGQK